MMWFLFAFAGCLLKLCDGGNLSYLVSLNQHGNTILNYYHEFVLFFSYCTLLISSEAIYLLGGITKMT